MRMLDDGDNDCDNDDDNDEVLKCFGNCSNVSQASCICPISAHLKELVLREWRCTGQLQEPCIA